MTDTTTRLEQADELNRAAGEVQSMAVMGELAEAVAHDFNNIVSASLIHLGLLLQDRKLNAGQKESLRSLEEETLRAAGLTRQLLAFSRRRFVSKPEMVDLNQLVQGIEKLLKHLVREKVVLSFQPARDACWIKADVGQMEKLVMSLCLVLRDTIRPGGGLLLEIRAGSLRALPTAAGREQGRFVCLVAAAGHTAGTQQSVGSTRKEGEPLEGGWEFDTARQIAELHQGWMEIDREGVTPELRVFLPEIGDVEKDLEQAATQEEVRGGSETILLIEDEDCLRRVSAQSLRRLGYAVLDAADGDAALKLWARHQAQIDLLLADLLLPGSQSGYDLARLFIAQKPSLRVMLSSGNPADLDECSWIPGRPFFPAVKPYTARYLAQRVRDCLDAPA
jgi:CheY-like chemotaxis protein